MGILGPAPFPPSPPVVASADVRRHTSFVLFALALMAMLGPAFAALAASPAAAASGTASTKPVDTHDFPDPSVLYDSASGSYYAYATGNNSNLQVMSSKDLRTWGPISDPLPALPPWARTGRTWAPGVARLGSLYVMYYTAWQTSTDMECIGRATAPAPAGPFVDASTAPFICQGQNGGSIDANPFVAGGRPYLLWKSDDNHIANTPTHLWAQALSPDGSSLVTGTPTLLLTGSLSDWRRPIIEGPTMVANPVGSYDLFYGAGWWDTTSAGIGYAVCPSPLSACSNRSTFGPWMGTNPAITKNGPAGPNIFTGADGQIRIAYHAWGAAVGYPAGQRQLWIDTVSLSRSTPSVP